MVDVYHYMESEALEPYFKLGGIIIQKPDLYFYSEKIDELIGRFEPINSICFSAALNMFYQTTELKGIIERTRNELSILGFKRYSDGGHILFHRQNLLYLISRLIRRDNHGELVITGPNCNKNAIKDYYYCLAIINNMVDVNDREVFVARIIREYPPVYSKETSESFYRRWLIRYWSIYTKLIHDLSKHDKEKIEWYLNMLEKNIGISIDDYFKNTIIIVNWFLSGKFDINNPNSFYIDIKKFEKNSKYIKLIDKLSFDVESMKIRINSENDRYKKWDDFYRYHLCLFEYPFLKINKGCYCLVDLRFLIDRICSGFVFTISNEDYKKVKGSYGMLMEQYFIQLLRKIFKDSNIDSIKDGPDARLESNKNILIFEFTTEYYQFSSLYQSENNEIIKDFKKNLFKEKGGDKKRAGKFKQLAGYILKEDGKEKNVIPVFVTEKYFGDINLLQKIDKSFDLELKKVGGFLNMKPLILCLDDLEILWACTDNIADTDAIIDKFVECIEKWESPKTNKGDYLYSFSYFLNDHYSRKDLNEEYSKFFSWAAYEKEFR